MSFQVTFGKKQKAYTTHVEKNGTFFVQLDTKEAYGLSELSECIARHIKATGQTRIIPEFGLACLARSAVDKTWYRALVANVNSSKVTVFYVDYGNTEELSIDDLSAPADPFLDTSYQSVCCTIANFTPASSDFGTKLKGLILERETCCVFLSKSGSKTHPFLHFLPCYNALLYENERSDTTLAEYLMDKKLGRYAICLDSVEIGSRQNVIVSFANSPGKFWVQLSKNYEAQEKLMEELNTQHSLTPLPQSALNEEGTACCSLYVEDGRYYRAEIVGCKSGGKVRVWFGDYGNTENVSSKDVKILPHRLTRLPFSAIMCSLDGVLPVRSDKPHPKLGHIAWTPEASDAFSDLIVENEYEACFVGEISSEVYNVQLTEMNTGRNVSEILAEAGIVELPAQATPGNEKQNDFEYLSLEVGQTYRKIYITHVESPSIVWCQRPEYMAEMDGLTELLLSAGPSLIGLAKPEIGSPCCAPYSQDGSWNRASIVNIDLSLNTAQVLFVDYGNIEEVDLSELKVLPSDLLKLPAQAVSFSITGITSRMGDDWTDEACECLRSLIGEQEMNCTVLQLDADGYPSVQLVNALQPDGDIGRELVRRGYARGQLLSQTSAQSESSQVKMVPSGAQAVHVSPRIAQKSFQKPPPSYGKITLEAGSTYDVSVSFVDSLSEFYCQLSANSIALGELMDAIHSYCHSSKSSALVMPVPNQPILAMYSEDGDWYRARVQSSDKKSTCVKFVDYGNSEAVVESSLKKMPSEFLELPAQAIQCSLYGVSEKSKEANALFSEMVLEQSFSLAVKQLTNENIIIGDLIAADKSSIAQQLTQSDVVAAIQKPALLATPAEEHAVLGPPRFTVNSPTKVISSNIESPFHFHLQFLSDDKLLQTLFDEINEFYCKGGKSLVPKEGQFCVAKYSEDGVWYRARITSVSGNQVSVEFVDYGNSEYTEATELKALEPQFVSAPCLAVPCCLHGLSKDKSSKDLIDTFLHLVSDQELIAEFMTPFTSFETPVAVKLGDKNEVLQTCLGATLSTPQRRAVIMPVSPKLKAPVSCQITFVVSCGEFYCQLSSEADTFAQFMEDLHKFYELKEIRLNSTSVGTYCAAPFNDYWHRGVLSDSTPQGLSVFYCDYGNTAVVPVSDLRELDAKFQTTPIQAVKCSLRDQQKFDSEDCESAFEQAVLEKEVEVTFHKVLSDGGFEASVSVDGIDVCQMLEGFTAEPATSQVMTIPTLDPPLDSPLQCTVSYFNSCSDFYCQLDANAELVETLLNELYHFYKESGRGSRLSVPTVGSYCAVPYSDEMWYRGVISAVSGEDVTVHYIDYGNTDVVLASHVYKLDQHFCAPPVQAIRCSLLRSTSDKGSDLASEQEVEMTIIQQIADRYEVKIAQVGEVISETVNDLSQASFQINTLSPVLNAPVECIVSYVATCEEFYSQLSAYTTQFEDLMSSLCMYYGEEGGGSVLAEPAPGTYCAAPFDDDGSWYRGIITAVDSQVASVFYMDYGNTSDIELSSLRRLEPQFCSLPIQAIMSSLPSQYSNQECAKIFKAAVLEQVVEVTFSKHLASGSFLSKLRLNGVDIEQKLASYASAHQTPPKIQNCVITPLHIQPGFTDKAVVTVVNSSAEFYCQVVDLQAELDLIMLRIRTFCEATSQSSSEYRWKEKEFVLARFSEDETWYRAQILHLDDDNTAKVFYIDYGNTEVLKTTELRKITPDFCQLPAQAVKCALEGSLAYAYSEKSYAQWNALLLDQEMVLKCVSVNSDNTYSVDLERVDTGVDVMSLAISEKVLSPRMVDPSVEPTEKNIGIASSLQANTVRIQCVYPAELVPDSFHDVIVRHVESPSLFYSQFGQFHAKQLESLMNIMQDYYTSSATIFNPVLESSCTKGCFLAAQFSEDELWYRCQVEEVSETGVDVRFIDYGNCETVPLDRVRFLDPEFAKLPAQGIPCSLAQVAPVGSSWSDSATDKFAGLVLETTTMGQVRCSGGLSRKPFAYDGKDTVSVILKDSDDVSIGGELIGQGLAREPPCDLGGSAEECTGVYCEFIQPTLGESSEMFASHVDSPAQFWLQMPMAEDILTVSQADLAAAYEGQDSVVLSDPRVGSACCTRFSEDGAWYRAVVSDVSSEGVTVRFVDYGNSETVDSSQVFALRPNFLLPAVQAVECSLSGIGNSVLNEEIVCKFSSIVTDKELLVTFKKQLGPNKWDVTLLESGEDVRNSLFPVSKITEKISEMSIHSISVPTSDIKVGETYPVYIAFGDSPSKFFCQLVSESDKLEALMAEVCDYYGGHQLEVPITPGTYCVAQYSGSGSWYRAQITAVHSDDDIEVSFIDYGNSEHVKSEQICGLDAKFSKLPAQGVPCSLTQDLTIDFPSEVLDQFFQYDLNQEFKIKIRDFKNSRYIVDLYDQLGSFVNRTILRMLVSSSSQSPVTDKQSYVHLKYKVGSNVNAYISAVNSPTSFYCQPLDLAADLEQLMNEMSSLVAPSAQSVLPQSEVTPGKICLAQFSENNEWYRAVVEEVRGTEVEVLYVDYGNAEITTAEKVIQLPQQLQACPVQAIHCSAFEGLDPRMSWNEEHIGQFHELISQSDHVAVTITSVSETGQYSVEVSANGQTIDFSALLEQQVEEATTDPQPPLRSLTSGPADLVDLSKLPREGSAASSASLGSGSESAETETDSGSVGEPLIKAPFKLSLAVEESLDVNVVYVQSPSLFYVQRADCQTEVDNLRKEIEQYCASFGESPKEFSLTFHKGDYVLAKYSVDNAWYRAEVTKVDSEDGTTEVSFIDFGNIELIAPEDLIMCPANLLELPAQAIPCSLARVPRRDSWPFEYKDLINSLVEGKVLRATVVVPGSQGMRPNVNLVDVHANIDLCDQVLLKLQDECEIGSDDVIVELLEGEDVDQEESPADIGPGAETDEHKVDAVVQNGDAPKLKLLKEREYKVDSTHSVLVLSCESPHSFICQFTCESAVLESIITQLSELSEDSQLGLSDPPNAGDILAAQYSEDLLWYRARVESSNSENLIEVTFIDFGNSEVLGLDKLSFLTESLLAHPPQAVECFLNGIDTCSEGGVFSEEAVAKFLELAGEGESSIKIVTIDTANNLGVILTNSAGVDVGNALVECKLASPLIISSQTPSTTSSAVGIDELLPEDQEEPIVYSSPVDYATDASDSTKISRGEDEGESEAVDLEEMESPSEQSEKVESPSHLINTNNNNSYQDNSIILPVSAELASRHSNVLDRYPEGASFSVYEEPGALSLPTKPKSDSTECTDPEVVVLPVTPAYEVTVCTYPYIVALPVTSASQSTDCTELDNVASPVTPSSESTDCMERASPVTPSSQSTDCMERDYVTSPVTPASESTEECIELDNEPDITGCGLSTLVYKRSESDQMAVHIASDVNTQSFSEAESPVKPLPGANLPCNKQVNTNSNNNNDFAQSFPTQALVSGNRYPVKVTSIDSPEDFVCLITENLDSLNQIVAEMAQVNSFLPAVTNPVPGLPVAVFKTSVQEWARAVVLSAGVSRPTVLVYLVDNGNRVRVSEPELKPLLKKYADPLPPQAVKCQIPVLSEADINPGIVEQGEPWELTWPVSCTHHLNQLTQENDGLRLEIIASSSRDDGYVVKLLECSAETTDLRQLLVEKLCNPMGCAISPPSPIVSGGIEPPNSEHVLQVTKELEATTLQPSAPSKDNFSGYPPKIPLDEPETHAFNDESPSKQIEKLLVTNEELLPNEAQAVIPESSLEGSDLNRETSASTGEGALGPDKKSEAEDSVKGVNSCSEQVCQSSESPVQSHELSRRNQKDEGRGMCEWGASVHTRSEGDHISEGSFKII